MKQNDWLFNIRIFTLALSFLFAFSSCNKIIRKVEVTVYNVSTGEGIQGIRLFFDDETYTTDLEGKVEIKKNRNMSGAIVSAEASILNYVNADYSNACQVKNGYEIESKELEIPLMKVKVLKLSFKKNGGPSSIEDSFCISLVESENCISQLYLNYFIKNDRLVYQDENAIYLGFARSEGEVFLRFFNNIECGYSDVPDNTYKIPINTEKDTTNYVLYYK